jgi:hypothetical protein
MEDLDLELDEVVLFELPTQKDVEAFRDRLRPRWEGWSDVDEEVWLFTAQLKGGGDLAPLLRAAQELLAELGLEAIRYCVDGRLYMLDAARPRDAADLAA